MKMVSTCSSNIGTTLVHGKKRKTDVNIGKCSFCQSRKQGKTLSSTDNGRLKIKHVSDKMKDEILAGQGEGELSTFVYHMQCYRPYVLKGERLKETCRVEEANETSLMSDDDEQPGTVRSSRKKARLSESNISSVRIICNQTKSKGDKRLYRISEVDRAQLLLEATCFNLDSIFDRTSTLQDVSSVFAADIMCHKKCIN